MASSRIITKFHTFLVQSNCKNTTKFLHCSCQNFGKKYSYNLGDLIKWKKETDLAFGPTRKSDKKGKFKKTQVKAKDKLQESSGELSQNYDVDVSVHNNPTATRKKVATIKDTEQEYDIPVLKSVPRGSTGHALKRNSPVQMYNSDVPGLHPQAKNDKVTHDSNTFEPGIEENDDIHIPKISPVPKGQNVSTVTNQPQKILDKVKKTDVSISSPVEPPDSYGIINNFPFCMDLKNSTPEHSWECFKLDVEKLSLRMMPSVKTILNKTMPELNRFFLHRWRESMIKELGEEGFKLHQDATIKRGINLHANVMEFLSGKPVSDIQIMPDNEGHWASLQTAFDRVKGVEALEMDVKHPILLYRGVFDCVAKYRDVLCVIDWKTSKKPRPLLKNTYDDPVQVVAYMGALNSSPESVQKFGQINHGMIVVAYPDGSPAHVHVMSQSICEGYWQDWTDRLYKFYQLIYTDKHGKNLK